MNDTSSRQTIEVGAPCASSALETRTSFDCGQQAGRAGLHAPPSLADVEKVPEHEDHVSVRVSRLDDAAAHTSPDYCNWLQRFQQDPDSRITQHPDYVINEIANTPAVQERPALMVEHHGQGDSQTMAILLPKDIRPTIAAGLGPAGTLHGYRLAGNRLLGDQNVASQRLLLSGIADRLRSLRAGFLLIEDLDDATSLWAALQAEPRNKLRALIPGGFQERLRIRLPAEASQYWSKFSSKTRYKFRRRQKRIGETRLVRVTRVDQSVEFLQYAQEVSLNSWQTQRFGLRVKNDDSQTQLLTTLALHGALRCYLLFHRETPLAFVMGHQFHGCYDYEEVGYDRRYAEHSPGQVLLLKVLEDLFEHDQPEWLDFGGGDADYKRLFANHTARSGNVWLMPTGCRSLATIGYLTCCRALNRGARQLLSQSGLMRRLRQWSRRH